MKVMENEESLEDGCILRCDVVLLASSSWRFGGW